MGRKRQEGGSSQPRYKLKAYRTVAVGVPQRYAEDVAEAMATARAQGIGVYRNAYQTIKPVLMRDAVPSALYGLYKAYTNEIICKVMTRKIATLDDVQRKWQTMGLDAGVLSDVADAVTNPIGTQVPQPAQKQA